MKLSVIIDGYSTGTNYVNLLKKNGFDCLHIQSKKDLPKIMTSELDSINYKAITIHEDVSLTIEWVKKYGIPSVIVTGSDTGVELTDILSEYFKLPTSNGTKQSKARFNKYLMMEAVSKNNIRGIKQLKTNTANEAILWIHNNLQYPVVVKPLESGGGEGFFLCESDEQVINALSKTLSKLNLYNNFNEYMLVQEYIKGEEYVVNTVSCNGKHFVTDFWKYDKFLNSRNNLLYRSIDFLPRKFEHSNVLEKYTFSVLDALGIKYGPVHAEIKIDKEGPVLMEVNCRPQGGGQPLDLLNEVYGHNQVALSVLAYTATEIEFLEKANNLSTYMNSALRSVFMVPHKKGIFKNIDENKIYSLQSFKKLVMYANSGEVILDASNVEESLGKVYLQHVDPNIIEKDTKTMCQLETNGSLISYQEDLCVEKKSKNDFKECTDMKKRLYTMFKEENDKKNKKSGETFLDITFNFKN